MLHRVWQVELAMACSGVCVSACCACACQNGMSMCAAAPWVTKVIVRVARTCPCILGVDGADDLQAQADNTCSAIATP